MHTNKCTADGSAKVVLSVMGTAPENTTIEEMRGKVGAWADDLQSNLALAMTEARWQAILEVAAYLQQQEGQAWKWTSLVDPGGLVRRALSQLGQALGWAQPQAGQGSQQQQQRQQQPQGVPRRLAQAGDSLPNPEAELGACMPVVTPVGVTGFVTAEVCVQDLDAATSWLASQPRVLHVDVVRNKKAFNLHASAAVQTGGQLPEPLEDIRSNPNFFPYWQAGLDGKGQVVGVADTGLDMDSCYFYDPAVPFPGMANASVLLADEETGLKYWKSTQ